MDVFFRVLFVGFLFAILSSVASYLYGHWLLKRGFTYIGHWYIASAVLWRKPIRKYCPYHGDEKCPCWNCPDSADCPNAFKE